MPNSYTFASLFTACGALQDLTMANALFAKFMNMFSIASVDSAASEAAILMFIKCNSISDARKVSRYFFMHFTSTCDKQRYLIMFVSKNRQHGVS